VSCAVFRFLWRYIFWHTQWDHNRQDGRRDNTQRFIWRVALRAQTTHRKDDRRFEGQVFGILWQDARHPTTRREARSSV
jgi:uncharacterized protein (DUF2267 family)